MYWKLPVEIQYEHQSPNTATRVQQKRTWKTAVLCSGNGQRRDVAGRSIDLK